MQKETEAHAVMNADKKPELILVRHLKLQDTCDIKKYRYGHVIIDMDLWNLPMISYTIHDKSNAIHIWYNTEGSAALGPTCILNSVSMSEEEFRNLADILKDAVDAIDIVKSRELEKRND